MELILGLCFLASLPIGTLLGLSWINKQTGGWEYKEERFPDGTIRRSEKRRREY